MTTTGETIHGLSVIRHCGGGAYGEVYYCRDISGKHLALKVVSKAKLGNGWERELKGITNYRALTEAVQGLLPIYHVGEDEESFYYTMEPADAVPGEGGYVPDTLAGRLAGGALPAESVIPVLREILDAIVSLHHAGFAHRDIKPENILFVKGKPCLADLGLLSPLSGTMTQMVGTLEYLPPEERTGESSGESHASRQRNDLYAFGKIIYCCVTGNRAGEFPSMPPGLPLTLVNKLFFRLSLRLCDTEPALRLDRLEAVVAEFERTVRMCQFGERLSDRLHYACASAMRALHALLRMPLRWYRRHPVTSSLLTCGLCVIAAIIARYIASRPDRDSEALAVSLQEQKQIASETKFAKREFTFYNGVYTIAVPSAWSVFGKDKIASVRLPGDRHFSHVEGVLVPAGDTGSNTDSVVAAMILPVTREQLFSRSYDDQTVLLKSHLGEDIEAVSIRAYRNPRLNLETVLFIGNVSPGKTTVNYVFPQRDHSLVLSALIAKENLQRDMGTFLAVVDSLAYRLPKETEAQ